ncbi:MAG: phage holin family protein [Chloroflexi bacterium]|nr:phage holin family protein [Chloroflexota bacterium]
MRSFLLRLIINAVALFAATQVGISGLRFDGDWKTLAIVALIFGVVNALIRPLLTILTCPLILLTLGLFTLVINAAMLALTGWFAEQFKLGFVVDGFWAAFVGGLVVSIVSWALALLIGGERERR